MVTPISEAKRHFKLTLKVRYRAERKVKHTLERPGIWPFNKMKREGTTTTLLECDDCVIRVAEANLGEVVKMMSEDPSLKNLVGFYSDWQAISAMLTNSISSRLIIAPSSLS